MESAIFRRGRPTNFTLGTGMEPVSPTCWVTPKATGQGNVMSSVRCTIAYNSTTKSHRNTKTDRKVSRSTPHIRHQFQGQMVKGLGHQAAMTENQPCFRIRKAYEHRSWYTDGARRPALKLEMTRSWKFWVAVQFTTCRVGGILWRPRYRSHGLLKID